MVRREVEILPTSGDSEQGGNAAKGDVAAGDADEGFLFIFLAVLLVAPAQVDGVDRGLMGEGVVEGHDVAVLSIKGQVGDEEGERFVVDRPSHLVEAFDVILLCPLAESGAAMNNHNLPIVHGVVD